MYRMCFWINRVIFGNCDSDPECSSCHKDFFFRKGCIDARIGLHFLNINSLYYWLQNIVYVNVNSKQSAISLTDFFFEKHLSNVERWWNASFSSPLVSSKAISDSQKDHNNIGITTHLNKYAQLFTLHSDFEWLHIWKKGWTMKSHLEMIRLQYSVQVFC